MNELKVFLNQTTGAHPVAGQKGIATDWLHLCDLKIESGALCIFDPAYPPDDSGTELQVRLAPGIVKVEAMGIAYGADHRIAAIRCVSGFDGHFERGRILGEVSVDTGRIGIGDAKLLMSAFQGLTEDQYDELLDLADSDAEVLKLKNGGLCPVLEAGFGDGSYPVQELLKDGVLAGVEIQLIAKDAAYPFEDNSKGKPTDKRLEILRKISEQLVIENTGLRSPKEALLAAIEQVKRPHENAMRAQATEFVKHFSAVRAQAPLTETTARRISNEALLIPEIAVRKEVFESAGYRLDGVYEFEGIPNYFLVSMTHPVDGTLATIDQHSPTQVNCMLEAEYPNGTTFFMRDTPKKPGMTSPPWASTCFEPGLKLPEMIERFRQLRPSGNIKRTIPQSEADLVADYHRVQQWRIERGGWNREEVIQQLNISDTPENADRILEACMKVREKWLFAWLKTENLKSAEEFRESLLIVHDELTYFILQLYWVVGTGRSLNFTDALKTAAPRDAFKRLNQSHGNPFQLIAQKSAGFMADFYAPS
jgi:hypothetical protein